MEAFLQASLPRLLPLETTFRVQVFGGKRDLLAKLESRLRGYARWLPDDYRIVVAVDRDNEECLALKERLEEAAHRAGLLTRTRAAARPWQVVNRVAIEELEAWYFGDWEAVRVAYPRVSATIPNKAAYRIPDAIAGGTWEAFERIPEAARIFHDRVAQDGGGQGHRGPHRPGAQPLAKFQAVR